MNQEKIGKFIAKCRKNKNMTQTELASILGVTDRAVSNWENGRRLPDPSLMLDLCTNLDITLNELFAGEKLKNKEIEKVAEKNILNILNIILDKNKRYKMACYILAIILFIFAFLIGKQILVIEGLAIDDSLRYTQSYDSSQENIKGDVNTKYFEEIHVDFEIGANKYGIAVFKNPEVAYKRLKKDYKDGIKLIQKEFNLLPLSNFNYKDYKTFGWQVTTGTIEEQEEARFVSGFFDIYENSFN